MMGSIPIPNTRFYLTSIDGKKWFVTEYYRTAPFNPDKETYDLYKEFAEAFTTTAMEEPEFQQELKKPVNKAYGNGLYAGRHSIDFGGTEQEKKNGTGKRQNEYEHSKNRNCIRCNAASQRQNSFRLR